MYLLYLFVTPVSDEIITYTNKQVVMHAVLLWSVHNYDPHHRNLDTGAVTSRCGCEWEENEIFID